MRHLHFECIGGASGDMMLGALMGLGVSFESLRDVLNGLLPDETFEFTAERTESMGIAGLRLGVVIEGQEHAGKPAEPEGHAHHHGHHHHDHDHKHSHDHSHRTLTSIKEIINASSLSDEAKQRATVVFEALGRAEAKIHGVPVEHIHFHEVGAVDSILDIVGACWALTELKIDTVSVGIVPLGHGTIQCAHGVYPNPAPASLELLTGMPVAQVDEPFELVTPTGAALLSQWRNTGAVPAGAVVKKVSYGLGQRKLNTRPNALRATLFEALDADDTIDTCHVLECNLDDTTPELIGGLMEALLDGGALDVTCSPVTMKKQRPGTVVSVLCDPEKRGDMLERIFRGSTTFGVREYTVTRTKLERRFETVTTVYGDVKVKIGTWRGEDITRAPEMDDCMRIARENNVSVRTVYEAAQRA